MPKERLQNLLAELNRELDDTPSLDPELATRLRQAADAAAARLDGGQGAVEDDADGIIGELLEADQRFEVAHPTLAGTLRQILATLSNMGI